MVATSRTQKVSESVGSLNIGDYKANVWKGLHNAFESLGFLETILRTGLSVIKYGSVKIEQAISSSRRSKGL